MPPAPIPDNEQERLAALCSYEVLGTSMESVYDNITKLAAQILGCPIAAISLVDADRQWFKARYGLTIAETARDHAFCAHTILSSEPLIVPDATRDARFADSPLVTTDPGIRFYAGIPLVSHDGFALGALCVQDLQPRTIDESQIEILGTLAQAIVATLEVRRFMRQAQHLATTDSLTGLVNRSAFLNALQKALSAQRRSGGKLAVAFLDLDGFKQVNDTEGHEAGDQVLRQIAMVLGTITRQEDVVARFGGDEFAVIFVGGEAHDGAEGERLRAAIQARMEACGRQVTASVGSACFFTPPACTGIALAEVDKLMYEAKAAGRNVTVHRNLFPDPVCQAGVAA
jgi:diguanylate cyclase (GGDEF)-like protein